MNLRNRLKIYSSVPLTRHLLLKVLEGYKRPNDKISELLNRGELIAVKRGLYVVGPALDLPQPHPFLVAQHLKGPSYISLETSLAYWQAIPERTFEISSITPGSSQSFQTSLGRFTYRHLSFPYYFFGLQSVQIAPQQYVLMASLEKAICDQLICTSNLNIRSAVQMRAFLFEDLRLSIEVIEKVDVSIIKTWIDTAPKKESLRMLIQTIQQCCSKIG